MLGSEQTVGGAATYNHGAIPGRGPPGLASVKAGSVDWRRVSVSKHHLGTAAKLLGALAGVSGLLVYASGTALAASGGANPAVVSISATVGAPSSSKTNSVEFTAAINPHGYPLSYCFDYGLTAQYNMVNHDDDPAWKDGETTPAFLGAATTPVTIHGFVYGLKPGTTYHYRIVLTGHGTIVSKDKTFKTQK